ncbi:hypothetical protein [Ralstonia pseudosolanacearum]|uniref:AbiU2 domain-containing protein n=1 Tax=Ralstonia pseudosolanacearum TaxID=1310165 RepID=UPI001FF8673D|nr:hypothetical protein [Ralstonia pseudosolanacearum]
MTTTAKTFDKRLEHLKGLVNAAQDEIILAVMLHETWKPTAYDDSLHRRMGHSYATHTFQIVRSALRREMLLTLARLWDTNPKALRMTKVEDMLRDKTFFDSLVAQRAARLSSRFDVTQVMRETLEPKRDQVLGLIRKYLVGGEEAPVLQKVRALRHQRLAHRQVNADRLETDPEDVGVTDKEIEAFYVDTIEIVTLLLSLVLATAFDIGAEATSVYQNHARFFWAAVRGERTEGHPYYRALA